MSEEVIDAKVYYFIDYWRDLLYFNSIEEDLAHTVVYNPRELFRELADEISRKEFKNKGSKGFFLNSINKIYNFKIESIDFLKPTLSLILNQFNTNHNFQYLLHLLSIVDRKLSGNKLGINCIDELENTLTGDAELNSSTKEKIKILTKLIVFELIDKEYSVKSIEKIIYNIFDKYQLNSDGILTTSFPHNCKVQFSTSSDEFDKYQEQIKELIDNLDISTRLLSLKNYFDKEANKLTYIFQIKGLKGNINSSFGNVRIYNPQTTQLIQKYFENSNVLNEFFNSEDFIYCNGAVTLEVVDDEYAKKKATLLLSEALDVLLSAYSKYESPIKIDTTKILVCDEDGNQRGVSDKLDTDNLYHHKSIDIGQSSNIEFLENYYNSTLINKSKIDRIIIDSLHWKRKATGTFNINDQILWYWISIENLFKNTSLIFDILPKLRAVNNLYSFAWKHYRKLQSIDRLKVFSYFKQDLEISEELRQEIGFTKQIGESVHLNDFIDNIANLKNEISNDCLLYDQLDFLGKVFSSSDDCIKLLESFEQIANEELIFVYRIRNKIVHSGNRKHTTTSNYYLNFAHKASSDILFEFITKRNSLKLKSANDILNEIMYDYDTLKIDIKENKPGVLLNK